MDKKQILQKTALEIFVNKGFINTPVRDIIDESGLGTSTFYRNFKNKEDVLKSLLDDFLKEILLTIENYYKTEDDLKKRFIETKKIVIDVFIKNKGLAELYVKSAGLGGEVEKSIKEFDDKFIEASIKNISYGIDNSTFQNLQPTPIAYAILGIIKYSIFRWIVLKDINQKQLYNIVLSFHESLGIGLYNKF